MWSEYFKLFLLLYLKLKPGLEVVGDASQRHSQSDLAILVRLCRAVSWIVVVLFCFWHSCAACHLQYSWMHKNNPFEL